MLMRLSKVVISTSVLSCLSVAVNVGAAADTDTTSGQSRPNIVFILSDDMGYGEVTAYGHNPGIPTPNIDRIAKEGARFTQYYTAAPICSPTRAGILTGQFPGRNHLNSYLQERAGNRTCDQNDFLDPAASRLPKALQQAGYKTFHIGKWHLGGGRDVDNAPSIREYGFDEYKSTWESPEPHPDLGVEFPPWDRRKEPNQVERHKRTEYMVDQTLDFLKRHKGRPCFVNLWPDDMHTPHRPGPEMRTKYGADTDEGKTPKKSYLGVLEEYDRQIGRLLDGLKEQGIDQNTVVIFTTDNGPAPHFDHLLTGGLRGMKVSLYEGGIRVPFMVRWPGHVPAGYVDEKSLLSAVDLHLTMAKIAGAEVSPAIAAESDGEDKSEVLLGKPAKRQKPIFFEYGRKPEGYGRPNQPIDLSPNLAVRDGDWKLLINDDGTSVELYRILEDPKEEQNLADKNSAITRDLSRRALEWRKTLPGRTHK